MDGASVLPAGGFRPDREPGQIDGPLDRGRRRVFRDDLALVLLQRGEGLAVLVDPHEDRGLVGQGGHRVGDDRDQLRRGLRLQDAADALLAVHCVQRTGRVAVLRPLADEDGDDTERLPTRVGGDGIDQRGLLAPLVQVVDQDQVRIDQLERAGELVQRTLPSSTSATAAPRLPGANASPCRRGSRSGPRSSRRSP